MDIKILHLYYNIMNLYGDYGNIVLLKKHIEDQNVKVLLDRKSIYDDFSFNDYDFIFIGAGTERSLDRVIKELIPRKEEITKFINDKKFFLATGNSFEMFGNKIDNIDGIGVFDFIVKRDKDRTTSDVIYECESLKNPVVGFVNMGSKVYHNMNPLFKVSFGIGENENNDYEGVKYKNFYGTHISGPVLAKNPEFLKNLVLELCKGKNPEFKLNKKVYNNEEEGYKIVLEELMKRKMAKNG